MNFNMTVSGIDNVQRAFNTRLRNVKKITKEGMTDIVLDCLGKSVENAPVDLGDLRGSGHAEINNRNIAKGNEDGSIQITGSADETTRIEGVVGFSSPYAAVQHESLNFTHPKGGKAKYLEDTVSQNSDKWIKHLARKARERIV